MNLKIYANRSGWPGDLGLEHVAEAVQRSLLDFQNTHSSNAALRPTTRAYTSLP